MQVYSEPSCSFVFILNKKPVFLLFSFSMKNQSFFFLCFFYSVLPPGGGGGGGKVGFILVNSVLQSLLSAFIQTQNVPVEG